MSQKKGNSKQKPQPVSDLKLPTYLHWLVLAILCIFATIMWWPTRMLPYHWDSAGFVINATRDLKADGFIPWVAEHSDFAHPPLLMTLLGWSWMIGGEQLLTSHVLMWVFLPILMYATYWLYLGLMKDRKSEQYSWVQIVEAALCALVVGLSPVVLAEYGIIYIDLPAGALAASGLALAVHQRWAWSILLVTLAGLTKEAVLMVLPAIWWLAACNIWKEEAVLNKTWEEKGKSLLQLKYWQRWFWLSIPAVIFLLWLWYHQLVTGWWLVRPERPQPLRQTIGSFLMAIQYVGSRFMFAQGRWLLALAVLGGGLVGIFSKKLRKWWKQAEVVAYALVVGTGVSVYAWRGEFALRYAIFMLPPFVVLGVYLSKALMSAMTHDKQLIQVAGMGTLLLSALLFVQAWNPNNKIMRDSRGQLVVRWEWGVQEDMSYRDIISLGDQLADFLSINYPEAEIFGDFPEVYQLTQPYQGYVSEPLDFATCKDFIHEMDKVQLLILHPYSPGQQDCRRLLNYLRVEPISRLESGAKWMEVYQVIGGLTDKVASPAAEAVEEDE